MPQGKKKTPDPVQPMLFEQIVKDTVDLLAERDELETAHLGPKGKRKPKRKSTERQIWAHRTFRVDYAGLPPGTYSGKNCTCYLEVRANGTFVFEACKDHGTYGEPAFDLPPEYEARAQRAELDRATYYDLPVQDLDEDREGRLYRYGFPWNRDLLGDFGRAWGKIMSAEPCGCGFTPMDVRSEPEDLDHRSGKEVWAVLVRKCEGVDCDCRFPRLRVHTRRLQTITNRAAKIRAGLAALHRFDREEDV